MPQLFTNNAWGTLASQLNAGATSLALTTGQGARFPSPTGGDYFLLTLIGLTGTTETSWEIVKCTARSTDTLTIVRAQEGTSDATWAVGTRVELRVTAAPLADLGQITTLAKTDSNFIVGDGSKWVAESGATARTSLGLGTAATTASTDYAPAAKGVTNGDSHNHDGGDGAQIAYASLSGTPTLGTAAAKNIPATGNASATEVVYGSDTRLTDARTPASHATGSHSDWPAAVSMTEVGYLDGVTSGIQTQLNARAPALTDDLDLYVATTGSDSNPGTSGSPFLTIQKAIDVATSYYLGIYSVTINLAAGTYDTDAAITLNAYATGGGSISIVGDEDSPASYILTNTSSHDNGTIIQGDGCGTYSLQGFKVVCQSGGYYGIAVSGAALIFINKLDFGLAQWAHIYANAGAVVYNDGGYTISDDCVGGHHLDMRVGAMLRGVGTITLTGTPAFGSNFVLCDIGGLAQMESFSFSGSATGKRYTARAGGIIATFGGASFLPGNSAGSTESGGIYA